MVRTSGSSVCDSRYYDSEDEVQVCGRLSPEVRNLILTPPDEDPYDTLRTQLIKRTAASEQRGLQQLFTTEEQGDRKPTQLLRWMQHLLGDKVNATGGSFLRKLFLQQLPANVGWSY